MLFILLFILLIVILSLIVFMYVLKIRKNHNANIHIKFGVTKSCYAELDISCDKVKQ